MARSGGVVAAVVGAVLQSSVVFGQTTAGTSATIVIPVIAQTSSFGSEVSVYNPNGAAITVSPVSYDAQNTATPGPNTVGPMAMRAGQ